MTCALKTIIANIKHAIRNNETVEIGGGLFNPSELQPLVNMYNTMHGDCDAGEICIGCKTIVCPESASKE